MSTLSNLSVELSVDLLDFLEIFLTDRQTDLTLTLLIFWCPRIPAKSVCLLAKTMFRFFVGPPSASYGTTTGTQYVLQMVSNHDFWLVANRLSRDELSNCLSNCRDPGGNILNFKKSNRSTDSSTDRFESVDTLIGGQERADQPPSGSGRGFQTKKGPS